MAIAPLNPYIPGTSQAVFIPDRLIAGDKKIVTMTGRIAANQLLFRGAVLGRVTSGNVTSAAGTNTGNGTIGGVALGNNPTPGTYTITLLTPTTFSVKDANGASRANGTVGSAYENSALGFVITAGTTAFVAGDTFTVTSTAPTGEYILCAAAATDGSQNPVAILVDAVDSTTVPAPVQAGLYLEGEFNANALTFGLGNDAASVRDPLAIRGIHIKFPVSGAPTLY